ncbi:MAG: carboxypeptidase M32 [Clostridiales bacterium]|nr:carboxypeptidase M32 [Clostridiales bacterium]
MDIQKITKDFKALQRQLHALNHASGILSYDAQTVAPAASDEARGETLGTISKMQYELLINDQVKDMLQTLTEQEANIDLQTFREAQELQRDYKNSTCIPKEEFVEYIILTNKATSVWRHAKNNNDFEVFRPYLEELVKTNIRFASYRDSSKPPYDVLLDDFEPGMTQLYLSEYFKQLRDELVPLVREIGQAVGPATDWLNKSFGVSKQAELSDRVMALMGVDKKRCILGQTEHPFTEGFNKWDVRITTHYHEDNLLSSLYSVIHEAGHALYELGIADELQFGRLAGGVSMGIHESQSRLYENMLGRSLPFAQSLLPMLKEGFPEVFASISSYQLYQALNAAKPSLIRVEADELTYSMHIMVRFELEKALFDGSLLVKDLPGAWRELYQSYLGVEVPDDRRGVLQDIHWSGGSFGYFPSYSVGSAYAAQIYDKMAEDIDVEGSLRNGNFAPINGWLKQAIHRHGGMLKPEALLVSATGKPFDVSHYTGYLTSKYKELYNF